MAEEELLREQNINLERTNKSLTLTLHFAPGCTSQFFVGKLTDFKKESSQVDLEIVNIGVVEI